MKYSSDKSIRNIGLMLIILGISILLIKPLLNEKVDDEIFYISGYSEIMSEQQQIKDTLTYSITIANPSTNKYVIKSIEPILP